MNLLKYLDVLIGLAIVMVLLSPLVSGLTQLWMWLSNTRSGRLQAGLKQLLLQLNGNPYERFATVKVTGLAAGTAIGLGDVTATSNGTDPIIFQGTSQNSIPELLKEGDGTLTFQTGGQAFQPAPDALPAVTAEACGPVGDWEIAAPATDGAGVAKVTYEFPGPAPFASWRAVATIPAGTILQVRITSGPLKDTPLIIDVGPQATTVTYPQSARPVPKSHELEIRLANAANGTPMAGQQVRLRFERNNSCDQRLPIRPPLAVLSTDQANLIARAVLLHPMIAQPSFFKWCRREGGMRGEVVEREEFIRILLEFAADSGGNPLVVTGVKRAWGFLMKAAGRSPSDPRRAALKTAKEALKDVLAANDIKDPARALSDIRAAAQEIEKRQPAAAAHQRLTDAILSAAQSSFVGKINNWFDQAMQRTTAEYKFRAQLVTVLGAFIVAVAVQMDSLDLLKRLSTDDKLRDSLVRQAQDQQARIDAQTKITAPAPPKTTASPNDDELQLAKARREDIEANLAKLREPQMSVLPDHFVWQPLPQARLVRNPAWSHPYSKRLELVVGGNVYPIEPLWTDDFLVDIRAAIDASGAPVRTRMEQHEETTVKATKNVPDLAKVKVKVDGSDRLVRDGGFARAALDDEKNSKSPLLKGQELFVLVGYDAEVPIQADERGGIKSGLEKSKAAVSADGDGKALTATSRDVRWIELRTRAGDFRTNILKKTEFIVDTGHLNRDAFVGAKECSVLVEKASPDNTKVPTKEGPAQEPSADKCDMSKVVKELNSQGLDAKTELRDYLVLVSDRKPPLQLRSTPGRPETNMLSTAPEWSCNYACINWPVLKQSWLGIVVTWMLLSLGASFWYDALKDLLKLRSSLAKTEEAARNERQQDTTKPAPAPAAK